MLTFLKHRIRPNVKYRMVSWKDLWCTSLLLLKRRFSDVFHSTFIRLKSFHHFDVEYSLYLGPKDKNCNSSIATLLSLVFYYYLRPSLIHKEIYIGTVIATWARILIKQTNKHGTKSPTLHQNKRKKNEKEDVKVDTWINKSLKIYSWDNHTWRAYPGFNSTWAFSTSFW